MKILITGGHGQLGRALTEAAAALDIETLALSSQQCDITCIDQLHTIAREFKPTIIIHAAAYTAVDQAETAADLAFKINALGTRNVAAICQEYNSKMVYISTDYVFDGTQRHPYTEFERPNPLNVYGRSKLAGELLATAICAQLFIIRTAWLYGSGQNFVQTILRLARSQPTIRVVDDQIGTPTSTVDLARAILALAPTSLYGTYHMSSQGQCSWFEFAQTIVTLTGLSTTVEPIHTSEFPRPAPRPTYSVLQNYMLELAGNDPFPPWQQALAAYLQVNLR